MIDKMARQYLFQIPINRFCENSAGFCKNIANIKIAILYNMM